MSVYLYYYLNISPNTIASGEIKNNINLEELKNHPDVLKNEEITNMYIPPLNNNMAFYFLEYKINEYTISVSFIEIFNLILLTNEEIQKPVYSNLIDRHIKFINNLTNKNWFEYNLSLLQGELSADRFYNIQPLNIEIKTKLYDYQIDNIHWMANIENNLIAGKINPERLIYFPDGRIYNYSKGLFQSKNDIPDVTFRGGIIADDPGIGKTVQVLAHCCRTPNINTLIIVPMNLVDHWENEIAKHFSYDLPFIHIINFTEFMNFTEDYDRIVIDEIHELYSNDKNEHLFNKMINYDCKYKWGITGTPFAGNHSLFAIIKFLTTINYHNYLIERNQYNFPIFRKLFRKNTRETAAKFIHLPELKEHNKLLTFIGREMDIYMAETMANNSKDVYFLRKLCCDIHLIIEDKNLISEEEIMNVIVDNFKNKWKNQEEILLKIQEEIKNAKELFEKTKNDEVKKNIENYEIICKNQKSIVDERKSAYNFIYNQITTNSDECPICVNAINKDDGYCLTPCSHILCKNCGYDWINRNESCPFCRKKIVWGDIQIVTNHSRRRKYSTKIAELLDILKNGERFIFYTQFDQIISNLTEIFKIENISYRVFEKHSDIDLYRENNEQLLIISSARNASGLDLSFVRNIVIFEPFIGNTNFLKDIEKQLIGRIYRIGQTENINIFRLIIRNTIEEEIYKGLF